MNSLTEAIIAVLGPFQSHGQLSQAWEDSRDGEAVSCSIAPMFPIHPSKHTKQRRYDG